MVSQCPILQNFLQPNPLNGWACFELLTPCAMVRLLSRGPVGLWIAEISWDS